ncbi:MAG: UvrB/UvrC motif-containing protein [Planctomycetota bacterium]|nr:UvrB/UvrC motif-containing protein [Planctomycetota bacterium]
MGHPCDICKKKRATIHLTDIQGNVKREVHLCEECAQAKGMIASAQAALPQILAALGKRSRSAKPKPPEPACQCCGITWSEFRAKGRLGCANDYEVFGEKIAELIANIHGKGAVHEGKRPRLASAEQSKRREILECRRRLREAIAREAYEEAAQLRDRLAELEGKTPPAPRADQPKSK